MSAAFPKPVIHGGMGKRQQEKSGKNVLDFSASLNPLPPQTIWKCDPESLSAYPDNEYHRLKECIGRIFHRETDEICVGNGSIELIRVFCSVTLSEGKSYWTEHPTFGEYSLSALLAGAKETDTPGAADVSFVCNPNNPTGSLRSLHDMESLLDCVTENGTLFADEAFIELADPAQSLAGMKSTSLFTLRSLTKSFAVPGIRFGYGFGDPALIEKMETVRPPWSVNAYAEAFALAAFAHYDDLEKSRQYIREERKVLAKNIEAIGFTPSPSSVNYLLIECNRPAGPLCSSLASRDILVRDCTSFGLPTCIRVAVRTREENARLVEALSECVR